MLLGISIEDDTGNLVLHGWVQLFDGTMTDCSTLTVTTNDDSRIRALGSHGVQGILHQLFAPGICTTRECIGSERCSVIDSLSSDSIVPEVLLEAIRRWRTDNSSLDSVSKLLILDEYETYHVADLCRTTCPCKKNIPASTLRKFIGSRSCLPYFNGR